jgi:hypothetical protein
VPAHTAAPQVCSVSRPTTGFCCIGAQRGSMLNAQPLLWVCLSSSNIDVGAQCSLTDRGPAVAVSRRHGSHAETIKPCAEFSARENMDPLDRARFAATTSLCAENPKMGERIAMQGTQPQCSQPPAAGRVQWLTRINGSGWPNVAGAIPGPLQDTLWCLT